MGSNQSSFGVGSEYQPYDNVSFLTSIDLKEEVESIYIISVPLKGSNWQKLGKMLLTISIVGAPLNTIIPDIEHHGLIFKTKDKNYFYAQFPSDNGRLIKSSKKRAIEAIIDGCDHEDERKWLVREKFKVPKNEKVTIKTIYDIIRDLKFEYYNSITKNCQHYVEGIIYNLPNISRVGYKGDQLIGGFNSEIRGDLAI